jgi:hypothetical protein
MRRRSQQEFSVENVPTTSSVAGIPPVNLQADAEQLHGNINSGYLLPTHWYADPAIFRTELERIHRRPWHFATHTDDLKVPGDVYIRNIAGVPIMLVRDADLRVRGYINIWIGDAVPMNNVGPASVPERPTTAVR